jgi:hypothetical protein
MSTHTGARSPGSSRAARRLVQLSCAALVLGAAGVAFSGGAANAADNQNTTANATVQSGITLTALTPSFTLTGTPGATVNTVAAVTYNVETNNVDGYTVTVQSASAAMAPATPNGDTIPIADLTVRESGGGSFAPVTTGTVIVHSQAGRSSNGGDNLSTDFRMRIPTVKDDTYTATLNYLATAAL